MEIAMYAMLGALLGVLLFIWGGKWERRKMAKDLEELFVVTLLDALTEKKPEEKPVSDPEEDEQRRQWVNLMNYNGTRQRGE